MRIHTATTRMAARHHGRVTTMVDMHARRRLVGDHDGAVTDLARGDGGYTLAMSALMIVPLMVFLAFAVDLGAWYGQASKVQRAADAAAMAGVVWLPDSSKANIEAQNAAKANGITAGLTYAPIGANQYSVTVTKAAPRFFSQVFGQQAFDISRTAVAQFNKPVPMGSPTNKMGNDVDPAKCPGSQPVNSGTCAPQPLLWSAANGPYDVYENGDLYSTKCAKGGGSGTGCTATNAYYRTTGYQYAVDVAAADVNNPLTIQVYDIGAWPRTVGAGGATAPAARGIDITTTNGAAAFTVASGTLTAADVGQRVAGPTGLQGSTSIATVTSATSGTLSKTATATGTRGVQIGFDCNTNKAPWNAAPFTGLAGGNCQTGDDTDYGQNMDLQLYDNDGSDLTVQTTTPLSCHLAVPATTQWTAAGMATYKNTWASVCTFTPTKKGIYPLVVRNSGFVASPGMGSFNPADTGAGTNAYALKVNGGSTTQMYSLNDMSIFTNAPGSTSRFYLAEIKPEHAGKILNVDLYDPGDGSGTSNYVLQLQAPAAGAPATVPSSGTVIPAAGLASSCKYNATPAATKGTGTLTAATNCSVITHTSGNNIYNGNWLRFQVQIDPAYTCNTVARPDCWWTISYNFGAGGLPTDRTVWSISVVGDPVHLIQ